MAEDPKPPPLQVAGEIVRVGPTPPDSEDLGAPPVLPDKFSPRVRGRYWDYYGAKLPEYLCYACEYLSGKVVQFDPEQDRDFLRGFLARLHQISRCKDRKASLVALGMIGNLAGLAIRAERAALAGGVNVNFSLNVSDIIVKAREQLRLIREAGKEMAG